MAAFYNVAPFNHRRPDMFQCLSRTVISLPESPGDGSPSAFVRGSRFAAASTSFLLQTLKSPATTRPNHERITPRYPSLTRRISDGRS